MKTVALAALFVLTAACSSAQGRLPTIPAGPAALRSTDGAVAVLATDPVAEARPTAPPPAPGAWIGAAGESDFVLATARRHAVGVWVDVPAIEARLHVPTAVTLAIDTSGSMEGQKIEQARAAARAVVNALRDGDIVAVHAFSDGATEIVPPTALDRAARERIAGAIAELGAHGATNLSAALELAESRMRAMPGTHPVRRIVLVSDGRATAGRTDVASLSAIADAGEEAGVQVTALGVGLDYDENALNALAQASSGRLYHLSEPREMVTIIEREMKLLDETVATDALVEIVPAPGVRVASADGQRATWGQSGALRVPLGAMWSGQRRELVVRLELSDAGVVEGKRPLVAVRLHFRDPADGGMQRVQETLVHAEVTTDPLAVAAHRNPTVVSLLAMSDAARLATAARDQVALGSFADADAELAQAQRRFEEAEQLATSARDRERMSAAVAAVAAQRSNVAAVSAAPPAARPSLQRDAALKANDFAMDAAGY
ncbi:MAG: VWA domain-containing protein [Myxococcales bacterium]|nr:VWA domain-containing protein [Myxococcales bacterium]